MADRSSFRNWVDSLSSNGQYRVGDALANVKHVANEKFSLGDDEFDTPGSDSRLSAAYYGVYRRACRKNGDPVGEYQLPEDDE